ncbi:hypothetical protein CP985_01465 [Malaciobacter mytili LMG 24559]|uniref:Uncharacterized protein n=1 Tax=Malaciobacter mytili LMG 24559 TaxID=1032238 RepID=A0AAX2AIK3_9BACT|nr:EAL domain-containing protein [Malaciobacter mytili]AXH14774.1 PAS sensor-containing diguanylate cyclase/phosphodiesterase [Malaciobacter mytili LMG 24559]RXK16854.1 hypothetical protein CP985_01465 [Malaciobacter mytili LMG 24559]
MPINILLIEDSKSYSKALSVLLEQKNYKITPAYTFADSQKILKNQAFNFIILDLILPDKEGEELIKELSLLENNKNSKIIVLSGEQDIQKRNFLFEHGVVDYLSKQAPLKDLVEEIDTIISDILTNNKSSILVVDDSSFVRKTMKLVLSVKNYNILLAADVQEALEILKKQQVDLIFSDLEMPNIDGIEFINILKKDINTKDIPILVLSGSKDRESYAKVLKHGAIDFIRKPFLNEEILLKANLHIKHSKQIQEIANQAKELSEYKRLLNESDIISKANPKGIITYVNDNFVNISGYTKEELLGKPHNIVRHPDMSSLIFKEMWEHIKEKKTYKNIIKNRKKDGNVYYVDATISPILDINGEIKEIIGIRHDITDIMNPKRQLLDDLKYIENPILIFLEIVNYKLFQDFYSETIMHQFEEELAKKLLEYFPEYSGLKKVYNLSNGLFALLKNQYLESKYIDICLGEVIKNFKEKGVLFRDNIYDMEICLSYSNEKSYIYDDVSLGIKYAIETKTQVVYAKDFYRRAQIEARKKLKILQMIKDALANDNSCFESHFQGIIDNNTQEIVKYESLVRLKNKNEEPLTPYHFLELSKKTGYYTKITKKIIENSFKALKLTNKDISINLSGTDIENIEIRNLLLESVMKEEFKGRITFELLEDENIKDFNIIKDFISLAKLMGNVKIAIDDFGSGYSNFERLLDFQPDFLKIDGSLIKNIVNDEFSRHVVEAIILFAKKQKIKTVAEFVENEEIFNKVKELGIDYSQGYYFHKPQKL